MELFLDNSFKNRNKIIFGFILVFLMLQSCATHHTQFGKNITNPTSANATDSSKIAHTFFLMGDAGNPNEEKAQQTIGLLEDRL